MIRVNTIAMLDGSIRTVELGTLEAIELCERVTRTSGRAARNLGAWSVLALANIDAIEVKRRGVVRRAKLYYLRDRRGKSARIAERQIARPAKGAAVPVTGATDKGDEA